MMQNLKLTKWNLLCWAALLLWGYIFVGLNIPYAEPPIPVELAETLGDGTRVAIYDSHYLVGWPLTYIDFHTRARTTTRTTSYHPVNLHLNIVIILLTLCGVVITIQTWMPDFSVRTLLLVTAFTSVIIAVDQRLLSTDRIRLERAFILLLYFAPLIGGTVALVRRGNLKRGIKLRQGVRC